VFAYLFVFGSGFSDERDLCSVCSESDLADKQYETIIRSYALFHKHGSCLLNMQLPRSSF